MEPKILVMGHNQDYLLVRIDRAYLDEKIPQLAVQGRENFLSVLRQEDSSIPAKDLRQYGAPITILQTAGILTDGLEQILKKATYYAQSHSAPYVLVQNLTLKSKQHDFDIFLSAQLLID